MKSQAERNLISLLDEEYQVILDGRFQELADLSARKEQIVAALVHSDISGLSSDCTRKLQRQSRLLVAVSKGMQAAKQRREALESVSSGGGYYTRTGSSHRRDAGAAQLERNL